MKGKVKAMNYIGIDIGSTAAKTVVYDGNKIVYSFTMPSGWNSKETAKLIQDMLLQRGYDVRDPNSITFSTGYGRVSVPYALQSVTEITCHGRGSYYLLGRDCTVIDVGGQDTKVISLENGQVSRFLMNDKCSAGTGKFIEILANRLNVEINEMFALAEKGVPIVISSMCTVFAESEVIGYMGNGESRENIAAGVINSIVNKVGQLCGSHVITGPCILTGGLSLSDYFIRMLSERLHQNVIGHEMGKYAGALGAALIAKQKSN